ncbi:hypothetical protein Lal_00026322, partial [Lupinus albus]
KSVSSLTVSASVITVTNPIGSMEAPMSSNFVFMANAIPESAKLPDNPPDNSFTISSGEKKMSFRDIMLADSQPAPVWEEVDFLAEGLARVELVGGNRLLPTISFSESVINEYSKEWRDALIVTLDGKRLGFKLMREKLRNVWRLAGDFDMLDIENGFFMVKFSQAHDRDKVLQGGPCMVFDHYVAITAWTPEFDSTTATVSKTFIWIRLTGKFARICVEIDLNKCLVGKVCVQGHWHKVGLHILCSSCGCYGHVAQNCTVATTGNYPISVEGISGISAIDQENPSLVEDGVPRTNDHDPNGAMDVSVFPDPEVT